MNSIIRLVALVAGFFLLMHVTPSWSQPVCVAPGCNPTVSDANGNSAGGMGALVSVNETPDLAGGFFNTAFGLDALTSNTRGDDNTAIGVSALRSNTGGFNNTAIGTGALQSNTRGASNTASGVAALLSNTTGGQNTASGAGALQSNTTGNYNTASGTTALLLNTTGNANTASGLNALAINSTGDDNTASGVSALGGNISGIRNTAVGTRALQNSTGNKNIGIGYQAGLTLTNGNNNIFIGNQGAGDESQTIRIGTGQTGTFIAGIATANVNGATVEIDASGQLGIKNSSARYKQDIVPMGSRSEKVLDLRPVTFAYREDSKGVTHYGLIAEEVATVYPDLVTRTASGEVQTVKYQELIPMLLNELQRQRQELARQQQELAEVAALREELAELRALAVRAIGGVVTEAVVR